MSPAKCAVVEHPTQGEPTCCLAHGSASAFICTVHTMLYLMGKAVAAATSAVTSCRCAEHCCYCTEPMLGCCMLTLLHFQILSTMSNSKVTTDSHVLVLTGTNYVLWRPVMKAYLQPTGHMWVMEITKPDHIDSKSTNAQVAHYIGWTKVNDSIIRSVNMHLSDALCQCFEGKALVTELLKALDEKFSTVGIAMANAFFKVLLDLCIPDLSHPLPAFSKVEMLFACLKSAGYEFNDKCQAIMLLAKLLPSMDVIAQMFTQAKDTSSKPKDPSVTKISKAAVVMPWPG